MNARALQDYCRSLPGATEDIKWGADLVFSVGGKMFAGFHADGGLPLGFPCSDEDFDALTARIPRASTFCLDVPEINPPAVALAERHRMSVVFETARMYTGANPDLDYAGLYGIGSLELG